MPAFERVMGIVKWFDSEKGYGFIRPDNGPDIFVHQHAIRDGSDSILTQGDRVEFSIIQDLGGPKASDVVRVVK